jgi:Gram-negative bacterial TonB protein C-terminal
MSLLLMLLLSVIPQNTIVLKGATPGASDAVTPVPEQGSVAARRYRNAYFNLSYPLPAGWTEQPAGPPPSEAGAYTLAQFALIAPDQQLRAHVLITAQDLFFSLVEMDDAKALVAAMRRGLEPVYQLEGEPDQVTLAGRTFHRLRYRAPRSGLHWTVLSTDTRCHVLTVTVIGTDVAALDAAQNAMRDMSLEPANAPACVSDYAREANVLERMDPVFPTNRFNTIPVRVIIGSDGQVKHVHLLSAYPEQSKAVIDALLTWRFKPYRMEGKAVEVETGIVFGMPLERVRGVR